MKIRAIESPAGPSSWLIVNVVKWQSSHPYVHSTVRVGESSHKGEVAPLVELLPLPSTQE